MNREQIDGFLARLELEAERDEGEWVMLCCPLAQWTHEGGSDSSPSFGVHVEDEGMSFYNCFTCKSKGPVSELAKLLGKYRDDPALVKYGQKIERGQILLIAEGAYREWGDKKKAKNSASEGKPTVFTSEREAFREYPTVFTEPRAVAYLRRRGIGFSAIVSLKLRYDPKQYRILFPVYYRGDDGRENLVGMSGRSIRSNRYIKDRNERRRGSYPKIRDYKGLEKKLHLLSKSHPRSVVGSATTVSSRIGERIRGGLVGRRSNQTSAGQKRVKRFVIIVEGLFGLARLETIAPDIKSAALMGSALTEGKIERLIERGDAIYWLTDNDAAGRACLFGPIDPITKKHKFKQGALYAIGNRLPQFIMHWPKLPEPIERKDGTMRYYKEDPDELIRSELLDMIAKAEIYIHRGT